MEQPDSINQLQQLIRSRPRLQAVGGGSKSALVRSGDHDLTKVSTAGFRGMVEYEPTEFTFTALAGTPLAEIEAALAEQGQYLPFDPPLVSAGATLGGTVAAGLSGSGRFAFGGLRDFILGIRLVNGLGDVVYGGGKVVKNAAGFDIPKLNVGALGRFGVITEFSFKVFPAPSSYYSFRVECRTRSATLELMAWLGRASLDLKCLDYQPPHTLWIRGGGRRDAIQARCEAIRAAIEQRASDDLEKIELLEEEARFWTDGREFRWRGDIERVAKVPITPQLIDPLEQQFQQLRRTAPGLQCRYVVGGNLLWIAWPDDLLAEALEDILREMNLSGLGILGDWPRVNLGNSRDNLFGDRIRAVFDPERKFARSDDGT